MELDDAKPEPPLPPGKKKRRRPRTKPGKGEKWKLADLVKNLTPESVTVSVRCIQTPRQDRSLLIRHCDNGIKWF